MTTNLLIFDLKIKDIDILLKSVNSNTKYVLIDYYTDTFELLIQKIKNLKIDSLNSVGLIREEYFSTYYKLFENQEPFILQSVYDLDRELKTWEPMVNFIIFLKENFNLQIFDFISCNLYNYTDYKYIFNILSQKTNIEIGASKQKIGASGQKIGNLEYNILNLNTKNIRNLKEIYFTDYINNYTGTFGATFVLTIAPAVPITYYSTSVKLNLTYGTSLLPGVNSSWKRVNTISGSLTISGNVNKYFMLSNTYGFAVANNSVTKSIDGGITWYSVTKPFNMQISDVYAWDQNNFIIWGNPNGSTSKIFKTIDGGTTWLDISGGYNSGNIYSMAFLNDIGYIGIANNIYRSTNYGYSWVNLNHSINGNPKKILMVSTLIIYLITTTNYFYYSTDGGITFSNISSVTSTDIATTIVDPSIIFSVNSTALTYATLTSMSFGNSTTPASSSINGILMPNNTTFYLFTTANYLYSVNNRSTWNTYTYNLTTTLSKFSINDYSIYGLGADNNLYRLYISYPGTLNYYSNNTLIKSYTMNKLYENNVYLSNLYLGNNNIYAYYVSNDTIYDSISSSIITLNVQQYAPYIYTNNTISGIIDHNYSIKLFTTTSSLIYETNTFFIQINKTPICQGTPFKISMVTNQIGFSCSTNGLLGKTIDGGITWSIIDTGLSYITNTKNKILDIFATDISNILLVTRNNIYRSYDSCVNWTLTLSNVVNILSATSINETFCYTNGTNTYYSTDFGQTFPFIFSTGNQISVHFGIKSFILWGKSNDIGYINDGIVATNNISSFTSSNVYSYDRSFGVSYNSTQVYLVTNNGTYYQIILTSTYLISFVIIVDSSTIFVATYSNTYYVSRNKGTNWATNTIQSPIIHFCKVNYGLYAICQDGNLYLLYLSYPGTINIYDNNNLLSSYKNNNAFNFSTFLLPTKNYSIYSIFVPDYSDYTTISSNVLNINIPQPKLSINTYNSISGIVNYNRSTKILYKTTFLPVIYDVNINFVKVNIQQTGIGGPIRIKMMTSKFGFISFMGSSISMTIDGCITWKIIDVNLSYYKSTRNRIRIIDLHAWDISNIMVGGGNRLAKTFDGGMSWYDISGSFNNDTNILSLQFFDETGYLLSNSNLYKTSNYGLTWIKILVLPSTPTSMSALNRSIIYVCYSNNYYSYSYNSGLTFSTPFTSGIVYQFINVFDENNVTFHNNGSIGLIINKETRSFYKTFSTIDFFFSSIYMIDLNTIIAFTTTNFYYISYDKGSTWSIYYLQTPIINANKIGNLIFAVDENGDVYQLILSYPGLFSIYDNNGLIQSLEQNSLNIQNIGFLNKDIQYLYAQIEPTISNYNTISSNIIQIKYNDTINIYTNYTLSGIINHGSTIKLYNRFSRDYLIEYNTNFIKYNQTNVINGQPLKIIMINSNLGFICGTGGSVSRTLDGGLSWLNLNSISYYSTVNYQPIDIFAWDISNIIVAGGNRIHKSFDGGNNWIDISGVYNTSNYIVSGMMFIDETGIITFNNYTNCFRSINYGLTWSLYINLGSLINNFYMYSKLVHIYGKTNYVAYVSDGITYTNYGNNNNYSICYIYNPLIYVAYFNNTTIHVFINNILVSTSLTPAYTVTSIIMSNENTIIVSTNSNYYYVSYNLGTTWSIFSLPVVIIYMYKKDYSIYGLGQDNNLYILYTTYPGTIQIYGNDTNLLSYKNDSFFNFNILGYLSNGSYNLYALFVPENSSYLSISSNILNISVIKPALITYTNYTLSGILNHGSTIKLYSNFSNLPFTIDYNTHFIKYNQTTVVNGQPLKIFMVNSNLGFICGTGGSVSRTLDGGLSWLNLNSISYYSTVNYQLIDIFAWDISNIIVAGGNRIHKSFDGGNNWIDISGVYNTSNYIVSGMMFIDETGIITFNNYTNCFRSINYGLTWSLYINLGSLINNFYMYSKLVHIYGKTNYVAYVSDGITYTNYGNNNNYSICYIYNPLIYVAYFNNTTIHVFINNILVSTSLTPAYTVTSIIMSNENTIIVSTNSNYYYVSYNLGTTWSIFSLPVVIIYMYKKDYSIYGLGQDNNLYILYTTYPGTIQIYGNDTNLLSYKNDSFFNFNILGYLSNGSYNLYALFVPENSSYLSISSNILNIIVNQIPSIYTNYTLSGIINHGSSIKLFFNNINYIPEGTSFFIKLNTNSVINGTVKKIKMTNNDLGFAIDLFSNISITTNGGITWNTIVLNIPYFYSNSLADIYGWDINNIIIGGGKKVYKTNDGGITWYEIIIPDIRGIVTSIAFIEETGYLGDSTYYIYRSFDYGLSWSPLFVIGNLTNIIMYNKYFVVFGISATVWLYYTLDGITLKSTVVWAFSNTCYIYDPQLIVAIYISGTTYSIYLFNSIKERSTLKYSTTSFVLTSVILVNENTIIVGTNTNNYLISYDLGNNWIVANFISPIIQLIKNNNKVYALCQNGNIYILYCTVPYIYSIYDNNNLLLSGNLNDNTNFTFLNNLQTKSYSLYSLFTPINSNFITLSSNLLNINVNQGLIIYTISSTINLYSTRIYYNYNNPLLYDYTTHFIKLNNTSLMISGIKKVRMTNQNLGYACGLGGTISRTTDGGKTWNYLTLSYNIYVNGTNSLIDIYGYDISNIITIGNTYMYKTIDGGKSWTATIAFEGNTVTSMNFINKKGFVGTTTSKIYETNDFGNSWTFRSINSSPVYSIFIYSSKFIAFSNNASIYWTNNGISYSTGLSSAKNLFIYNPTVGVSLSTNNLNVYYIYNNFGSLLTVLTAPGDIVFTDVTMISENIIIVTTSTNKYYISYNKGTSWFINTLIVPLISMQNLGYCVIAVGYDDNLYILQTSPGLTTIKNNDSSETFYFNSFANSKTIKILGNSSLQIIQNNNQSISSNILYLTVSDYYSIYSNSNIINYENQIKINKTTNINGLINSNMFFTKINSSTINSYPTGIKVYDSSSIFVFNINGYMSKSFDAGVTWSDIPLNLQLFNAINYSGFDIIDKYTYIIFDTSRNNNITGVLKTTDGGNSWINSNGVFVNNATYSCTCITFLNNIGFMGTTNGALLKSFDGGSNWVTLFNINNSSYLINVIKIINETLIFVGHNSGYFYTDGLSNSYTNTNPGIIKYIDNYDSNLIFFANDNTVYKTVNASTTYTSILSIPSGYVTSISILSNYLLVSLNTNYYYVSMDFGTTWSYFSFESSFLNIVKFNNAFYGITYDGNLYTCIIDPLETNKVYDNGVEIIPANYPLINLSISCLQKLYSLTIITTNINTGKERRYSTDILHLPNYSSTVPVNTFTNFSLNKYYSNEDIITANCDTTAFYNELQLNNNITNINFYDVSNGIACSFINGIFITQNSGLSWIYKQSNLGSYITSTFIIQFNKILATTNDGAILQSVDFGTSWSIIYQTYKSYLKNIYFVNSLFGAVCGYTNNILVTLDGGITFLNSYTGTTSYFNKVFITSISGTIYAVGTNNTIIRSYNNGLTWNNIITTSLIEIYFDINMYDENIGFVVGSNGYVLKTTDSFTTYKLFKLATVSFRCLLIYNLFTILVGGYNGILYLSTNAGDNWAPIGSGIRNSINYFNKINNTIRFGFNGGIAKLNYLSNQMYSIVGYSEIINTSIYNLNSIFAWYEPNSIVITNGVVTGWNDIYGKNNLTRTNGSLSIFKNGNLQMLSVNTVESYINLTNTVYLGGFICVVYFKGSSSYNYLFATDPINDTSARNFKSFSTSIIPGNNDLEYRGFASINGTTVYDYSISPNFLLTLDNTNTYIILYVKFADSFKTVQMTPSIGSSFQARGFTGYVGDFIFLNTTHTQNDRILIENYLANKWNLTSKFINPYNPVINSSYFINKIDFSTILDSNSYNLYNVFTPGSGIYNYSVSLSSIVIIKPKLYIYGQTRYYDTTSSVILMLSGVINNNVVLFSYNAYYQNANAENNKLIFYNNLVLTGELNSYFSYPSSSGTTIGNILQKPINVDFVFHDKIYDGNTNATLSSYIISNFYLQDTIDIQSNNIISILRNKNVGYQIVDISNIVIIGSTNYFAPPQTSYINIFQKLVIPINTNIYYSSSYESQVTLSGLVNNDFVYLISSLLPSTEIGVYDITISNYIDDNPVTDALFYYTFNIDTIYGYYIQNQYYIKSYNAQIYNSNNFIDSNNQKLGSSCLYLSNSSYIKINDTIAITNKGVTFSLWIRTIKPQNYSIFDFDFIKLYVNRFNNFSVVINNVTISSNIQCTNNTWNNIIFTINSFGSSKLYLNGNNILTTRGLYYYPNVYSNLLIGTSNISDYYEGFIDDFRFYNRVLENFEINMLFNSPFYSFNNLNLNYILSTTKSTNTIIPKPINIYTENKTYDGNNLVYFYTLSGIINNDILTLCGIVYYNDINVGYNSITVSGFLYGIHAYRYFIQNIKIFSYIKKKNIIPLFNFNKIYDNTYITKNVTYTLPDVIYSDIGTIDILSNYSSIYLSKYSTISGIVNVTNLSLYGSSINNYTIQNTLNYTGIITPKPYLPAEQLIKIYDGTNRIKITISGLFPTDDIIGSYAYFDDKNTGINKQINNTSISDVINYVNTGITVIPTPVGTAINSNIYTISGLTGDQAYQNGTYKFSASSNDSNSYRAFLSDTGIYDYRTTDIYSGSVYYPPGPTYNGNTTTIVKDVGIIRGEYIQVQFPFDLLITSFYYTPPDATTSPWEIDLVGSIDGINWILINCQRDGTSYLRKTSPVTYYSYFRLIIKNIIQNSFCLIYLWKIDGKIKVPGSEKYIYTPILPFYGNILPFPLNYSFTGLNKTYDGTNLAQVNKYLTSINGDDIDLSFNSFFNDSNAGYNKLISVYNVKLIGTDSSNYSLSYNSDYTFGTIYQKPLYVLFNNPSKTFDGNNSVILTYTLSGIIINDTDFVDICNNYIAYYSSINIGTNIPIIVSGLSLYGLKSINYTPIINQPFGIIN